MASFNELRESKMLQHRLFGSSRLFVRNQTTIAKLGKTFGEAEKETDSESGEITKIKENNMYKSFFQDFEKLKKDLDTTSRITSFEEQKSFKQVFDYLSRESNKIGVVKSLETFVNFQSPVKQSLQADARLTNDKKQTQVPSFFNATSGPINLQKQYSAKLESNRKLLEALAPTLHYINKELQNNQQMYKFVNDSVIATFVENYNAKSKSTKKKNSKPSTSYEAILHQSEKTPQFPLIDEKTLPVLLKFCINSLAFDFDSISTSLLIVENIKEHESIELYRYGMNIDVYNNLLIQVWSRTNNLKMVSDIIDELKINAIQPDLYTFKILGKIYLYCMRVKDSVHSEPYIIWNNSAQVYKIKDYLQDFRLL